MRGFTRRRGKTWTAYWDIYDPQTGDRRQSSKGGFARQKDAESHLELVVPQVKAGIYSEPSKEPLGRFLQHEWLPAMSGTVRPLTHDNYSKVVDRYVVRRDIGAVPLCSLSPGSLTGLYGELERDGLSPGTRRLVHAVLGRALRDAKRWGKIARNPAADASPPAKPKSTAIAWSARELGAFLAHVADDRLSALWRLAATSGARRGELLAVTWRALDLDRARLQIDQQLIPTPGGATFGPPKSERSERTIALDPDTVQALRRHRDTQLLERDLAGSAYEDGDLVFCDELGHPYQPKWLTDRFRRLRKATGISTGSLHILRHTSATLALTANPPVPLHIVAARLGDDPTILLGVYAHLLPRSDIQAAEAVAAILDDKTMTSAAA